MVQLALVELQRFSHFFVDSADEAFADDIEFVAVASYSDGWADASSGWVVLGCEEIVCSKQCR